MILVVDLNREAEERSLSRVPAPRKQIMPKTYGSGRARLGSTATINRLQRFPAVAVPDIVAARILRGEFGHALLGFG